MSKKIMAFALVLLLGVCCFTVANSKSSAKETNVAYVNRNSYAATNSDSTTSFKGYISEQAEQLTGNLGGIIADASDLGGSLGGLVDFSNLTGGSGFGGAIGDISNAIDGILGGQTGGAIGGTGSHTYEVNTDEIGYIDIVPAATSFLPSITEPSTEDSTQEQTAVNETVDFAATSNPYEKPTEELRGGDQGEGVKWMQWIFIYTRYGLKDDGITGIFDEDTMAVVKKLQKENGMTVDGIVDEEVIAQINLLYLGSVYSSVPSTQAQTEEASKDNKHNNNVDEDDEVPSSIIILVVVIAVIWAAAIAVAVILFIKKKKASNKASAAQTNGESSNQ